MTRYLKRILVASPLLAAAAFMPAPALADAVADFYRGRNVTILLGTGPGATYDFYARIMSQHLPRHIPGEPNVIVQYMPGAGGMNAWNHLYNVAPRDGTVFANVFGTLPVMQLFRGEQARYDAAKFNWLGSVSRDVYVLAVNAKAPATTLDALRKNEITIGSIGRGNTTYFFPALMNSVLDTRIKIISGYSSGAAIYKAMEAGETDGYAPVWLSLVTVKPDWLRNKEIVVLAQSGTTRIKDLPDVPALLELAKTDEHRQMVSFLAATSPLDRASAAPPGVPPERVAALEKALGNLVRDPAFVADMEKRKLTVDPSSAKETVAAVRQIMETPPPVLDKIKAAFGM